MNVVIPEVINTSLAQIASSTVVKKEYRHEIDGCNFARMSSVL
jgi:hypothetical protein